MHVLCGFGNKIIKLTTALIRLCDLTDKSPSERTHDAPANRWRRYRRAASFDSRKVVLLFSIL